MRHIFFIDNMSRIDEYKAILRQGDLDGACGVYSVIMSLHLCGVLDLDFTIDNIDKRTKLGKLIKQFGFYENLFPSGLRVQNLKDMIGDSFTADIKVESCETNPKEVAQFTINHIREGHPVIIGIKGNQFGHWAVAAGIEYVSPYLQPCYQPQAIERLFLLDPSNECSDYCLWNGFIRTNTKHKGRFPYYLNNNAPVTVDEALAIWKKQ